jgi:hypothetical protein
MLRWLSSLGFSALAFGGVRRVKFAEGGNVSVLRTFAIVRHFATNVPVLCTFAMVWHFATNVPVLRTCL